MFLESGAEVADDQPNGKTNATQTNDVQTNEFVLNDLYFRYPLKEI